ncbi:MAG: DUF3618 domain-containing protein [Corynebacteriales bacterium]|nr:DUF3618 domain-containing protein [Mycobacteriales bacterium]
MSKSDGSQLTADDIRADAQQAREALIEAIAGLTDKMDVRHQASRASAAVKADVRQGMDAARRRPGALVAIALAIAGGAAAFVWWSRRRGSF